MKVTKSRTYHVNLGNYEWVEFRAEVTLDPEINDADDIPQDEWPAFIEEELSKYLDPELEEAKFTTEEKSSFVHFMHPKKGTK